MKVTRQANVRKTHC